MILRFGRTLSIMILTYSMLLSIIVLLLALEFLYGKHIWGMACHSFEIY